MRFFPLHFPIPGLIYNIYIHITTSKQCGMCNVTILSAMRITERCSAWNGITYRLYFYDVQINPPEAPIFYPTNTARIRGSCPICIRLRSIRLITDARCCTYVSFFFLSFFFIVRHSSFQRNLQDQSLSFVRLTSIATYRNWNSNRIFIVSNSLRLIQLTPFIF